MEFQFGGVGEKISYRGEDEAFYSWGGAHQKRDKILHSIWKFWGVSDQKF